MSRIIGQRELRNDNARVMRMVEAGESFIVTRNGTPVADLVPHQPSGAPRRTLRQAREAFRRLPAMDLARWEAERRADDQVFGPDDPTGDPWGDESSSR